MDEYKYDFFVIGAGSAGVRAARIAGQLGARVGIAEDRFFGGTCVNIGCVPKKLFVYASHFAEEFEDAAGFGWTVGERSFDWPTLITNKNAEIERLNGIYERILKNAGVTIHRGRATVTGPNAIAVGDETLTAQHILVATGGRPFVPDIRGRELAVISDDMFYLEEFPKRVVVVGGGYIAVEFAGILNGLGAEVTQLYRGPHFLRGFDDDLRHFLCDEMRKKGIDVRFNATVECLEKRRGRICAELADGTEIPADLVLYATGRVPNSGGLGLEALGVELNEDGAVVVDDEFRTSVPSVFALGDVIDRVQLTPVALGEGMWLARRLFGGAPPEPFDYEYVPSAVFSQPAIGTVGLTEAAARSRYGAVDVYISEFRALKHTLSGNEERTLMKLVVDKASDRVVGAHMAGPEAGEIIQGLAIAIKMGATKAQFDATIGIHPTAAEEFVTMREPVVRAGDEATE
ncbi:MAG: glutathione-disulfide reductase [Rhodospirillales bacterium]|nr:MAG: glutathione-disulfide reductase [Rhodospirillales bacterium]